MAPRVFYPPASATPPTTAGLSSEAMTTPNLAKIERVELREAWPNEARDFTPWLAENITELGEALGMDLELQETEASVGGYSLDVLATDLNREPALSVIENQLEADES